MIARQPGEFGGEYYRLMPEGLVINHDGFSIKVNRDSEGLDLNRNFPAGWRQEFEQVGAGPYPTSEPEVRAMVDFMVSHPNIGAAISFHTHSGVILRPCGTRGDDDMAPEDLWAFQRFSKLGEQHTGYPAVSIWHEFKYHPKEVITRHAGLGLRAPGRAVLGGGAVVAQQGGRHHRLQVDRLVPRPSGRGRPQAAEVERRALRRQGACRVDLVHASAAGAGGDRRLGQDELLAQPAAAPARAGGGALPRVDEPDRAESSEAGAAAHESARWARTPGACAWPWATAAGCRPT